MHSLLRTFLLTTALAAGATASAAAQVAGQALAQLEGVDVVQKLDAPLPKDVRFTTDRGEEIAFGDLFDDGLPVLLTLNYTECPQLCSVHLTKLVEALAKFSPKLAPGTGYRIVTVSIDPRDTPEKAARMKAEYVERVVSAMTADVLDIERAAVRASTESAVSGAWTFLVGDETRIAEVADAVGFGFKWLPAQNEFAHNAVTIICTPDGRIARYLSGLDPLPEVLRLSLVEASEGKVGSLFDGIFLSCFVYDPHLGSYALAARRLMMSGGVLAVVGVLTGFFFLERSKRAAAARIAAEENVR
jgi:protein SCO1/2